MTNKLVNKKVAVTRVTYKAFDMVHTEEFYDTKMPHILKILDAKCKSYVVTKVEHYDKIAEVQAESYDPLIY